MKNEEQKNNANVPLCEVSVKKRRNIQDCKFWKPRGKKTNYCSIDKNDPLKRCYGVCKLFCSRDSDNIISNDMKNKKEVTQEEMEQINAKIIAMLDKNERIKPIKGRFRVTLRMDDICLVKLSNDFSNQNIYSQYQNSTPENNDKIQVVREYADGFTRVSVLNRKGIGYYIETKYLHKI